MMNAINPYISTGAKLATAVGTTVTAAALALATKTGLVAAKALSMAATASAVTGSIASQGFSMAAGAVSAHPAISGTVLLVTIAAALLYARPAIQKAITSAYANVKAQYNDYTRPRTEVEKAQAALDNLTNKHKPVFEAALKRLEKAQAEAEKAAEAAAAAEAAKAAVAPKDAEVTA